MLASPSCNTSGIRRTTRKEETIDKRSAKEETEAMNTTYMKQVCHDYSHIDLPISTNIRNLAA